MLSFSYIAFDVRTDTASTEQAKQLISLRQQTAYSEWWGEHTAGFLDMRRTPLCMNGTAGTKTAPHADWAAPETLQLLLGKRYDRLGAMTCMLRSIVSHFWQSDKLLVAGQGGDSFG